jgi:hypothetical protein
MNIEQAAKALIEGKYRHTRGRLRSGNCFCVGGVLCDMSGLGEWQNECYRTTTDGAKFVVPDPVCRFYGLFDPYVAYREGYTVATRLETRPLTLSGLNDQNVISFKDMGLLLKFAPWLISAKHDVPTDLVFPLEVPSTEMVIHYVSP